MYKIDSGIDRLGSGVRVSVSFQIFALTTGEKCLRWGGKLSGRGKYRGEYVLGRTVQGGM